MGNLCAGDEFGDDQYLCDDCFTGVSMVDETFEECKGCKDKNNNEKMFCVKCAKKDNLCMSCGDPMEPKTEEPEDEDKKKDSGDSGDEQIDVKDESSGEED